MAPVDTADESAGQESHAQDDFDEQSHQGDGAEGALVEESVGERARHGRRLPQRAGHLVRADVREQPDESAGGQSAASGEQAALHPRFRLGPPTATAAAAGSDPRQHDEHAHVRVRQSHRRVQRRRGHSTSALLHPGDVFIALYLKQHSFYIP